MDRLYSVSATLMVALMLGGMLYFVVLDRSNDAFAACRMASAAGGLRGVGGDFSLSDQDGKTVTQADLIVRPALVYFGYSFCPDCPLDLTRNALAVDILSENSLDVAPVFISIDPKRDQPDTLARFVKDIHPEMIALSGQPAQVRFAAEAYRVSYDSQAPDEDGQYLIDHTTLTYLVLPGHGPVEAFNRALGADELAERVACFLRSD